MHILHILFLKILTTVLDWTCVAFLLLLELFGQVCIQIQRAAVYFESQLVQKYRKPSFIGPEAKSKIHDLNRV
jgi:hypothetical protein